MVNFTRVILPQLSLKIKAIMIPSTTIYFKYVISILAPTKTSLLTSYHMFNYSVYSDFITIKQ